MSNNMDYWQRILILLGIQFEVDKERVKGLKRLALYELEA